MMQLQAKCIRSNRLHLMHRRNELLRPIELTGVNRGCVPGQTVSCTQLRSFRVSRQDQVGRAMHAVEVTGEKLAEIAPCKQAGNQTGLLAERKVDRFQLASRAVEQRVPWKLDAVET